LRLMGHFWTSLVTAIEQKSGRVSRHLFSELVPYVGCG
jgi:hypothetical protein